MLPEGWSDEKVSMFEQGERLTLKGCPFRVVYIKGAKLHLVPLKPCKITPGGAMLVEEDNE